jgi:hypothetical protein
MLCIIYCLTALSYTSLIAAIALTAVIARTPSRRRDARTTLQILLRHNDHQTPRSPLERRRENR